MVIFCVFGAVKDCADRGVKNAPESEPFTRDIFFFSLNLDPDNYPIVKVEALL